MKKVLLTGSSGMLGRAVASVLRGRYEVYGTYYKHSPDPEVFSRTKTDLTDEAAVKALAGSIKPDYVIHCAGLTNVDTCEGDYASAYAANALSAKYLASACGANTRFIYISTDAVFDGTKGNYSESDMPRPLNNYSRTKLEGERFIEGASKNYLVIRTNFIGTGPSSGSSLAKWVLDALSGGVSINMFTDVIFSPLYIETLAHYIAELVPRADITGKLNIAAASCISKYALGIKIARLAGFNPSLINPASVDSAGLKAPRPKNTSLNVSRAVSIFGDIPSVETEIAKLVKAYDRQTIRK